MFLLNIFLSLWSAGKDLLMRLMNALPMLVLTFLLYGGLNHITFLRRMRFCGGGPCGGGLNSSWCVYPLFLNASWYGGAASLKTARSDEMLDSRRLIAAGMLLMILEGWFDWL